MKNRYKSELTTIMLWAQIGSGAFMLLYILVHYVTLSMLLCGEQQFNSFINSLNYPFWIVCERVAFVGLIFHILNGVRMLLLYWGKWINEDEDLCKAVLWGTVILTFVHSLLPFLKGGASG